jgi:hypothetical protein
MLIGAVLVGFEAFVVAGRRRRFLLGFEIELPATRHIDRRLILGGACR